MSTRLIAIVIGVGALGLWWLDGTRVPPRDARALAPASSVPPEPPPDASLASSDAPTRNARAPVSAPRAPAAPRRATASAEAASAAARGAAPACAWNIEVRTRDAQPAGGAALELRTLGSDGQPHARLYSCDAQGRARLALSVGHHTLIAWNEGSTSPRCEIEVAPDQAGELLITLGASACLEGLVRDARSLLPIAGASIRAWTHSDLDLVHSDQDGHFRHPRLPFEELAPQLRFEAPGYAPEIFAIEFLPDGSWSTIPTNSHEEQRSGRAQPAFVDVRLEPEGALELSVLDPLGQPLPEAALLLEGALQIGEGMAAFDGGEARSDEEGRARLCGFRPDIGHALALRAAGCAELLLELPAMPGTQQLGLLTLAPESTLSGAIADAGGAPAEGLRLRLDHLDAPRPLRIGPRDLGLRRRSRGIEARTSALGSFHFEGLAAGRYRLRISRGPKQLCARELELGRAQAFELPELRLPPEYLTLHGRVLGRGAAGARVRISDTNEIGTVDADDQGQFSIAGLDGQKHYELFAVASDGSGSARGLVEGGGMVVLEMVPRDPGPDD